MHVTKFYFIQLILKIKYVEFEDNPNNFNKNQCERECFSARRLIKISYQKLENTNIGRLFAKVANNWFYRMHCDD